MSDNKRKKLHSPIRNLLYKIGRNRFFYAGVAAVATASFVVGIYINKNAGKRQYLPSSTKNSTTVVETLRDFEVYFIDVGQGDATLIKFPDGKNMLVDGGRNDKETEEKLDEYLTENGKKLTIDYCVATHSDADHVGSLDYVYKNYKVLNSFRPYIRANTDKFSGGFNVGRKLKDDPADAYTDYLTAVYNENSYWEFFDDESDFTNTALCGDDECEYSVEFLLPYAKDHEDYKDERKFVDANDFSAVIKITCFGESVLLTGDIDNEKESEIVEAYKSDILKLSCGTLKVAHHGSETSTSAAFIDVVKPDRAIISCGLNNEYGHPSKGALQNLAGITIYRTDLQGTIKLSFTHGNDDSQISVDTNKNDEYLLDTPAGYEPYIEIIKNNKRK